MKSLFHYSDFVEYLRALYLAKSREADGYTRSTFAKEIGLSHNRLSEIMSRKRGLSRLSAKVIAENLKLTAEESEYLCDLADAKFARSEEARRAAMHRTATIRHQKMEYQVLTHEEFASISSWYHFAIAEALKIENVSSPKALAALLALDECKVAQALSELQAHGLVDRNADGHYVVLVGRSVVPSGEAFDVIKNFHQQQLQKAGEALQKQALDAIEFQSLTVAIARQDVPKFKKKIQALVKEMGLELANSSPKTAVYQVGLQMFEVKASYPS